MLMEHTLQTLKALRLPGMLAAFEEQQASSAAAGLSFDERFAMLVDREQTWRESRRVARLLREARLKSGQACLEDVRYGGGRKLDRATVAQLGSCQWIRAHQNLILTGATGCGKTLAGLCAGQRCVPAGAVGCLCSHPPPVRGTAHRPWRRQLRQAPGGLGEDGPPDP